MIRKIIALLLNIKGDFQNLFIFNEYNELTGKTKSGIITLSVILGVTFLALGYAIGGINYLKEKMDDPFTNWVNLGIKQSYREKVPRIKAAMEPDTMKAKFFLNNIGEYNLEFQAFVNNYDGEVYNKKLRTIDLEDNLLGEIINDSKGNVISGYAYSGEGGVEVAKCGIIIKESTLIDLGYENVKQVNRIAVKVDDFIIYPEVVSVVKELPNLADLIVSSHFYRLLFSSFGETNFVNTSSSNQMQLLTSEKDNSKIEDELRRVYQPYGYASIGFDSLRTERDVMKNIVTLYFSDYRKFEAYDTLYNVLADQTNVPFQRYIQWECNVGNDFSLEDPYYLSFNFDKLDHVRDFKNYLSETQAVEISMDQVEQKENFALVSKLTNFISLILFGFSILSIVFYVNSLLKTHLEKIKTNLGTLKAFGLNNKFLVSSYLKIIVTFISISIVIAFIVCGIWDVLEGYIFENNYFDVFNYKILIAIVVILMTALFTSQRTINKTLLKTPGDLIYNR